MSATRVPLWARVIVVLICFLAVVPYFGYRFDSIPGDLYDARLNIYFLEHGYKWVSAQTPGFLDAPFFYPARKVLTYSENLVGSLPFYIPWRWMGADRETSFQFWVLTGFILNFLAVAFVLRKLDFDWVAGLAGAFVFSFSQVALTHLWHIQLHYRFAIPLALYFLYRFLEHFSWKDLLQCGVFIIWQFCCSVYEGYFLSLFLTVFFLISALRKPVLSRYVREVTSRSVMGHAFVALGCMVVLGLILSPYLQGSRDPGLNAALRSETIQMLPRPISYVLSYTGNIETGWLYPKLSLPLKHEHIMFVGLIPWICVLFSLVTARQHNARGIVVSALLAMFCIIGLTLYINGVSLYLPLLNIPAVVGMRAVTRSILVLLLPLSLAVAQTVHILRERMHGSFGTVVLIAVMLGLIVENRTTPYRLSKAEARSRVDSLIARFPSRLPDQPILAYLSPGTEMARQIYDLDAMLAAQQRNIPTMNGYSGREPRGYLPLRSCRDIQLDLSNVPQQNEAFSISQPETHLVTIGTPGDRPCPSLTSTPDDLPYDRVVAGVRQALEHVPEGSRVLVISKGDDKMVKIAGRQGWHFPGDANGVYSGFNPADSKSAIEQLENLRGHGAQYLVLPRTAFWWWHFYADMRSYVEERYPLVSSDETCVLYSLSPFPKVTQAEGYIDVADTTQVSGWAWDRNSPTRRMKVEIYDGTLLVGAVSADVFRPDLLAAQKGDGKHGFRYVFGRKVSAASAIRVLPEGSQTALDGPNGKMASR